MDLKLNHSDLSALFAKATGMPAADADMFTKAVFDLIIEGLENEGIVKINGLGTFKTVDVESRSSVNVNTGERIEIKGHKKMTFVPSDSLKETINAPFAMFQPVEVDDELEDTEEETEPVVSVSDIEEEMPVEEEDKSSAVATDIEEEMPALAVEEAVVRNVEETVDPQPEAVEEKIAEDHQPAEPNEEKPQPTEIHEEKLQPVEAPEKELKEEFEKKGYNDNKKSLYLMLSLFFVTVIAVGGYLLFSKNSPEPKEEFKKNEKVAVVNKDTIETKKDTFIVEKDTMVSVPVISETETSEQPDYFVKQQDFVLTDRLASMELSVITQSDTTEYVAQSTLCNHTVAIDETLIKISLKYYGDKRLWPYIVKYNKMNRPNDLACGMVLKIPVLRAVK